MVIAGALVTPNLFGQTIEEARNIRKYVSETRKMTATSGNVREMMRDASVPWKTAESELAKYLHQPSDLIPVDFVAEARETFTRPLSFRPLWPPSPNWGQARPSRDG